MSIRLNDVMMVCSMLFWFPAAAFAQAHEFPSSDIFVAQARANDIVCRDSALGRIPPHGSNEWIQLEFREVKEFGTNPDTIVSDETSAQNYISSSLNDLNDGRLHCPAKATTKPFTVLPIRAAKPLPTPVSHSPLVQRCTETQTLANEPPPWASAGWKPPQVSMHVKSCAHLDPGYTKCSCKSVPAVRACPNGKPPWD
jgi:hypothetical protein